MPVVAVYSRSASAVHSQVQFPNSPAKKRNACSIWDKNISAKYKIIVMLVNAIEQVAFNLLNNFYAELCEMQSDSHISCEARN